MPFGHIGEGPIPAKREDEPRRFYHQDGAIRVYANRSMVLAGIMSVVALFAVGGLIVVRLQPATVIRVGSDGQPSVLSPLHGEKTSILSSLLEGGSNPTYNGPQPDQFEHYRQHNGDNNTKGGNNNNNHGGGNSD